MYQKVMSKEQAESTIEKLTSQATALRKNGWGEEASQNERIIKKLKKRIANGKYN